MIVRITLPVVAIGVLLLLGGALQGCRRGTQDPISVALARSTEAVGRREPGLTDAVQRISRHETVRAISHAAEGLDVDEWAFVSEVLIPIPSRPSGFVDDFDSVDDSELHITMICVVRAGNSLYAIANTRPVRTTERLSDPMHWLSGINVTVWTPGRASDQRMFSGAADRLTTITQLQKPGVQIAPVAPSADGSVMLLVGSGKRASTSVWMSLNAHQFEGEFQNEMASISDDITRLWRDVWFGAVTE